MKLAAALLIVLLTACSAGSEQLGPPAGYVLAVDSGRLIRLPVVNPPDTSHRLGWEGTGSFQPQIATDGGALTITLKLDVLGSRSPYWLGFTLTQAADGSITGECELYADPCRPVEYSCFTAQSYADAAEIELLSGDTIGQVLARFADGYPPTDMTTLADRLAVTVADKIGADAMALIRDLDSAHWYDRENAAKLLAKRLPECRRALATLELSAEQRRGLELLTAPPAAGAALTAALSPNQ